MEPVTERFLMVIDNLVEKRKAKSIRQIALAIGIQSSQISEARSGTREFPIKYADELEEKYDVNKRFILENFGDMYLNRDKANKIVKGNAKEIGAINYPLEQTESPFIDLGDGRLMMLVPLVTERSRAGYLSGYADPEFIEELPKHTIVVNKEHRSLYRAFESIGDSMTDGTEDSIVDGSIVTGRFLDQHHWRSKLNYKRYRFWVVVHRTEGILTKEIINHDVKAAEITIHSLNPDKDSYPDQVLHLSDIKELYNIVHVGKNLV